MKILFAADIHVHERHLDQLIQKAAALNADALIIGGDIVPHNLPQAYPRDIIKAQAAYLENKLIPSIRQLKARRQIAIYLDLGNDDLVVNLGILEKYQGGLFQLLHMQKHSLTDSVDIVGYMTVPPTPFTRKDREKPDTRDQPHAPAGPPAIHGYITGNGRIEKTRLDLAGEDTIEKDLSVLAERIDRPFILVSHSPPYNTPLDQLASGGHVGSLAIRRFIEYWGARGLLLASLHGHIHESPKVSGRICTEIHQTLCINPGQNHQLQFTVLALSQGRGEPCIGILPQW